MRKETSLMKSRFETPVFRAIEMEHMAVCVLLDTSSSVSGRQIRNIVANVNRFPKTVCKDPTAAKCVDVCVIAFNDQPRVLQDWVNVQDMGSLELRAEGCTDLNGAVILGIEKLREQGRRYFDQGIVEKKPYLIVMTDGEDTVTGNVEQAARLVEERTNEDKLKLFFLGFGEYDRTTAAMLTKAGSKDRPWCFEVDNGDFNFDDFFDFVGNSVRAASVSAPGALVKVATPIGTADSNVKTVSLDDWLND